jgi:hypothetical protein
VGTELNVVVSYNSYDKADNLLPCTELEIGDLSGSYKEQ